jgi:hypothetical protein
MARIQKTGKNTAPAGPATAARAIVAAIRAGPHGRGVRLQRGQGEAIHAGASAQCAI